MDKKYSKKNSNSKNAYSGNISLKNSRKYSSEGELEFEGWIEFITKNDKKNKKEREEGKRYSNSTSSRHKLRSKETKNLSKKSSSSYSKISSVSSLNSMNRDKNKIRSHQKPEYVPLNNIQEPAYYINAQIPVDNNGNIIYNSSHILNNVKNVEVIDLKNHMPIESTPIYTESLPPLILKNEQELPQLYIKKPPTIIVSNKKKTPLVINPPPANVILNNEEPESIYVNNPRPNVIINNEKPKVINDSDNNIFPQDIKANIAKNGNVTYISDNRNTSNNNYYNRNNNSLHNTQTIQNILPQTVQHNKPLQPNEFKSAQEIYINNENPYINSSADNKPYYLNKPVNTLNESISYVSMNDPNKIIKTGANQQSINIPQQNEVYMNVQTHNDTYKPPVVNNTIPEVINNTIPTVVNNQIPAGINNQNPTVMNNTLNQGPQIIDMNQTVQPIPYNNSSHLLHINQIPNIQGNVKLQNNIPQSQIIVDNNNNIKHINEYIPPNNGKIICNQSVPQIITPNPPHLIIQNPNIIPGLNVQNSHIIQGPHIMQNPPTLIPPNSNIIQGPHIIQNPCLLTQGIPPSPYGSKIINPPILPPHSYQFLTGIPTVPQVITQDILGHPHPEIISQSPPKIITEHARFVPNGLISIDYNTPPIIQKNILPPITISPYQDFNNKINICNSPNMMRRANTNRSVSPLNMCYNPQGMNKKTVHIRKKLMNAA